MISILFVDNEEVLLDLARSFLEKDRDSDNNPGFEVFTAISPDDGWEILNSSHIDVIVSDYDMPGKNGLDFLKEIKQAELDIPFIIFTGRGREEIVIEAISLGVDFYVQKGGNPTAQFAELKGKIKKIVEFKKSEKERKETENLFQTFFEHIHDAILIIENGKIIRANTHIYEIYNMTPEEIIGANIIDVSSEFQPDGHSSALRIDEYLKDAQTGGTFSFEWFHVRKDGIKFYLEATLTKLPSGTTDLFVLVLRDITERKRIEDELAAAYDNMEAAFEEAASTNQELIELHNKVKENEKLLSSITNSFPGVLYRCRPDDELTMEYISSGCLRLTGYEPEELLFSKTVSCKSIILPEYLAEVHRIWNKNSPTDKVIESEYKIRKKNGDYAWLQDRSNAILSDDGEILHFEGVLIDVTRTREAEITCKSNAEIQKEIIDFLPDPTLVIDNNGRIITWNQEMERLSGVSTETVLGQDYSDYSTYFYETPTSLLANLVLAGDINMIKERYPNIRINGDVYSTEVNNIKIRGKNCIFSIKARLLYREDGSVIGVIETGRDITEIRKKAAELTQQEEKFRILTENQSDVIFLLDLDRTVKYFSPSLKAFGGYNPDEEVGVQISKYFTNPEEYNSFIEVFEKIINKKASFEFKHIFRKSDGTGFWIESSVCPFIKDGEVVSILGVLRDISDRVKLEDELSIAYEDVQAALEEANSANESLMKQKDDLHEKERFLASILGNLPGIIFRYCKESGELTFIDGNVPEICGYDAETLRYDAVRGFPRLFKTNPFTTLQPLRRKFYDAGLRYDVTYQIDHANGELRWVFERSSRIIPSDGSPEFIEGVIVDITNQKTSEDKIRQSLATIKTIFDNTNDSIIVHSGDGTIIEGNKKFLTMYDISPGEEKNLNIRDISADDNAYDMVKSTWNEVLAGKVVDFDWKTKRPSDGVIFDVRVSLKSIKFDNNSRIFAIISDITDQKRREREKEEKLHRHQIEWEAVSAIALNPLYTHGMINEFGELITKTVNAVLGADIALWMLNDDNTEFVLLSNSTGSTFGQRRIVLNNHPEIFAAIEKSIGIFEDRQSFNGYNPLFLLGSSLAISMIGGVIRLEDQIVGVVTASSSTFKSWFEDEQVFLTQVADFVSGALQTEKIIKQKEDLASSYKDLEVSYSKLTEIDKQVKMAFNELWDTKERLRLSETYYHSIFDNNGEALVIISKSMIILHGNDAFSKLTGYTKEEYCDNFNLTDLLEAEDRDKIIGNINLIDKNGVMTFIPIEVKLKTKGDEERNIAMMVVGIEEYDEYLVSIVDLTDKIKMVDRLTDSHERMMATLNAIPDLLIELDKEGKILDIRHNENLDLLFPKVALIGKMIPDILPGDPANTFLSEIKKAEINGISTGGTFSVEDEVHNKHWFALSVSRKGPLESDNYTFIAVTRDVTIEKMTADALTLINKKLNLLSGLTRHDILNHITACIGYLELIREENTQVDLNLYIARLSQAVSDIKAKIEFTRTYQDIGLNGANWMNLDMIIRDFISRNQDQFDLVKIEIPDTLELFGDPLISQVFFNLVENAIRHGNNLTFISISCETVGDGLIVVCEDDGGGVPDNEKEVIFERGYGKNTGFGLFLCREILTITGLSIIECGEPGKGARFEISIPAGKFRGV